MGDNTFHSALSPSARHRWGVCPGSIREEARYPEPPSGPAAIDGTRTHALLERLINYEFVNGEGVCGPAPLFGSTITDEYGTFTVDIERATRLNVALEYIRSRVGPGSRPIPEKRVHPDGLFGRADMSGTVDVQIPGKKIYEIIDFKDGMAPVDAKDNPQLEIYALGVLAELPEESHPETIRLTIIQPKLALRGMAPITSHDILTRELLAKVPQIIAEAAATDDPDAPLVPGEKQCKFCKAKGACSALAGKAMQEVNLMFSRVGPADVAPVSGEVPPVPGAVMVEPGEWIQMEPAHQAAQQDPHTMTDAQLRQILEAAPLMRQLIEGVEAEVQRRLESGKEVPGFKLVQGRGSRVWALPEEEMVKKLTGMGVPKGSVYETKLITPAKAEKLVWDKKGEVCKLSDVQLKRMQTEYVSTMAGKPTVAPESDPRPAIVMNAAPMFSAVEAAPEPVPAFLAPAAPFDTEYVYAPFSDPPIEAVPAPEPVPAWLQVPSWLQ